MTKVTAFGGIGEIGGNKILLESTDTRVFLDFGISYTAETKYFSEFLQPRKVAGLKDLLEFNLIPPILGIYRSDYLKQMGHGSPSEPSVDAVFLSHAHMDHVGYICHLRIDLPIYMGETAQTILDAYETTTTGSFKDFIHFKESFKIKQKQKGSEHFKVKSPRKKDRKIHPFRTGDTVEVGDLEINPVHVDHTVPGAYGFLIKTPTETIAYSGDLRFHGPMSNMSHEFVSLCEEESPKVLICEGTNIDKASGLSEQQVEEKLMEIIQETKELVVGNYPPRDIDRIRTFLNAAKANDRTLVIPTSQFYYLECLEKDSNILNPIPTRELAIYLPRKGYGAISGEYAPGIAERDYKKWERKYLSHENMMTYKDVKENQSDYVFFCNFFSLKELIDIKPSEGSIYIRSICAPFSDEMVLDEKKVENWLKHFKLFPHKQVHCSGHASGQDIKKMIETIDPEIVIPIHTEYPDLFDGLTKTVIHLRPGRTKEIS